MTEPPPASMAEAVARARALDAPLDRRLALIREAYRLLHGATAEAGDRLVARLAAAAAGSGAPRPGEALPPFLLPDEAGRLVALRDLLRDGPLAVVFLRGHWCPYCGVSATALHEAEPAIAATGGRIVAITPERRGHAARLKAASGAGFPILTDLDNGYALSLNLAIWVGEEMQARMEETGRHLPDYQGNAAWMLPLPACFVLSRDGVIVARHVDPDYRTRMDVQALLAALREAATTPPNAPG
jgi:peroxiredoxin